jgi:spore germination protein Q
MKNMVQYYWYPGFQQQQPQQQPQMQMPMTPPQIPSTGGRPPFREESYIENILRLNRGKPGIFHFSFERAVADPATNTLAIRGMVEAAGRDHVILSTAEGRRYLLPMIYFDYAEFNEELNYFNQQTF